MKYLALGRADVRFQKGLPWPALPLSALPCPAFCRPLIGVTGTNPTPKHQCLLLRPSWCAWCAPYAPESIIFRRAHQNRRPRVYRCSQILKPWCARCAPESKIFGLCAPESAQHPKPQYKHCKAHNNAFTSSWTVKPTYFSTIHTRMS